MDEIEFHLRKAIDTPNDRNCKRLVFRAPTVEDIERNGMPLQWLGDGAFNLVPRAMTKYMADLSGVPIASIRKMSLRDWNEASGAILVFFRDGSEEMTDEDEEETGS